MAEIGTAKSIESIHYCLHDFMGPGDEPERVTASHRGSGKDWDHCSAEVPVTRKNKDKHHTQLLFRTQHYMYYHKLGDGNHQLNVLTGPGYQSCTLV